MPSIIPQLIKHTRKPERGKTDAILIRDSVIIPTSGFHHVDCRLLIMFGIDIEEKAHAGNATQNIHPPLIQKTRIHIQPHTLHLSYIYWLTSHERHTQSKCKDRSTALARSVVVTYFLGRKPVYVRTTSLLSPILTL